MNLLSWKFVKLELSKVWKLSDSSRPLPFGGEKRSKVVFLIETKTNSSMIEAIKRRIGFAGCLVVDEIGKKGGWPYYGRMKMM